MKNLKAVITGLRISLCVGMALVTFPVVAQDRPPSQPSLNVLEANKLFNSGIDKFMVANYRGAVLDYTQALRFDPKNASIYIARGEARRQLGDLKGAIADQTQALKIDAKNIDAYTNRCAARYQLGDAKGAIVDCTQSLQINSQDADALYNRGLARRQQADMQGAIDDFQRSAELYQQQLDSSAIELLNSSIKPVDEPAAPPPSALPQPLDPARGAIESDEGFVNSEPSPFRIPKRGSPRGGGSSTKFTPPRGRGVPGRREGAGTRI